MRCPWPFNKLFGKKLPKDVQKELKNLNEQLKKAEKFNKIREADFLTQQIATLEVSADLSQSRR